jgi:RNA polymerase sigma factor (sigma-70 family)
MFMLVAGKGLGFNFRWAIFVTMHTTLFVQNCLERLRSGELNARDELITKYSHRLRVLTERMLRAYPRVARWEEADDVFQQAAMRLHTILADVVPQSVESFYRLGTLQLRRELNDLARKHFGPEGVGANHESGTHIAGIDTPEGSSRMTIGDCPEHIARWTEFHGVADQLPDIEKRTFELLWYHGLTQPEAAEVLGVSDRQLRRYWNSARLNMKSKLGNLDHFE